MLSGTAANNRNFTLLGDPALRLAYPEFNVETTLIADTLKALNRIIDNKKTLNCPIKTINVHENILNNIEKIEGLATHNLLIQDEVQNLVILFPTIHFNNIIANILTNSYKFRNTNNDLEISISSSTDDQYYKLVFTDNGIGFDSVKHKDDLFKLFKRFQLDQEGQGIGLYNIKLTMDNYNGNVTISSIPNHGTEVSLYFKKDL